MAVFIVVGAVGFLLVVVALIFGDVLDGILPDVSLGDSGGLFSTEVLGAFAAGFGLAGALTLNATRAPLLATGAAVVAGGVLGAAAFTFSRAMMRMPTDATPRSTDLVGAMGTVVTRIPQAGLGEVSVAAHGQRLKLSARADGPIAAGVHIVVVDVTSPTSVVVTESEF